MCSFRRIAIAESKRRRKIPPKASPAIEIPFNRPFMCGKELDYISNAISQGHISGDGPYTRRCESLLEEMFEAPRVLLTTSCTDALEMSALLLDLKPGDQVIVPSFTFVSTANAFVIHGATPVFVDIREDTLNIDHETIESVITDRTRAIVPVHYAGVGCEMDPILDVAERHHLTVIEDNAQGMFGRYRSRRLGTFGSLSTLSFHETKNITCGEGGALVIKDHALVQRAEVLREKGTNRKQFYRGLVDKYTWTDMGSSYLPSDLLAAFLWAQIEERDRIQSSRRTTWHFYRDQLEDWAKLNSVGLPKVPGHCQQPFHMFYLLLPTLESREALIAHLRAKGILAVFHYVPLHSSPMGRSFGGREGTLPVTERVSSSLVRLPFYNGMTPMERMRVVEAVREFQV